MKPMPSTVAKKEQRREVCGHCVSQGKGKSLRVRVPVPI